MEYPMDFIMVNLLGVFDLMFADGYGACRYGSWAMEISQDYYAAGVPSIYRQGAACGACYKVYIYIA